MNMKKKLLLGATLLSLCLGFTGRVYAGSITGTVCGLISLGTLCRAEGQESVPVDGNPNEEAPTQNDASVDTINNGTITYIFSYSDIVNKSGETCAKYVPDVKCASQFVQCTNKTRQDISDWLGKNCSTTQEWSNGEPKTTWTCKENNAGAEVASLLDKSPVQFAKACDQQLQTKPTQTTSGNFPSSGVGELGPPPQPTEITWVPGSFQPKADFTIDPEKIQLVGEKEEESGVDHDPIGNENQVVAGPVATISGGGCSLIFTPSTAANLAEHFASATPWLLGLAGLALKNRRGQKRNN